MGFAPFGLRNCFTDQCITIFHKKATVRQKAARLLWISSVFFNR
ncbi:hypothetical protein SUBVAR_06279 [Subdoligranulum variabile DSM 15176]|uniref:Uncharacterized protein n=1 Tax=Subdoligranulum variabile DSM 15176 TaxID=411471 RepID=D1PPG5_9FIRM|nr:hypothetical protein SUBVAR_06279 [Subdoligranulum variabile DSM 15176]